MTKVRIVVLLGSAVVLILVLLALQLLAPGDKLDQTGPGDAHIIFSADQNMVLAPGACLTVRWQVDHIQKVFFDDLPTVGQGFRQQCVDNQTMPVLHVVFQDGTEQDYSLAGQFFVEQPLVWLLAWIGILLLLMNLYAVLSRSSRPFAALADVRRSSRRDLFFSVIGLLFSGFIVLAVPLELGLRFYFGQFGTREEQNAYLLSREEIEAHQSELKVLPYLGFGLSPGFPGHNQLGYRGDDIQVPKPAGVYRIVVLGDSSTYGNSVPYDKTYPAELQQVLRTDYGYKNLEVVNGGVPNYTSWNMLMDLAFRVSELQPNLVIVYAGWNDLGPREQSPDCYSAPGPFLGLGAVHQVPAEPEALSPFALYRLPSLAFPSPASEAVIGIDLQCSPQVISEIPQNLQANAPVYFERNLREMIGIAKASGVRIMFMTWAYNTNSPNFPEVRRAGIAEHNAITTRVAHENDVPLFDNAAVASTDLASWFDVAHLSIQGSLEQAQKIAKFLVDQDVITQQ